MTSGAMIRLLLY